MGSLLFGGAPDFAREKRRMDNTYYAAKNLVDGAKMLNQVRKALPPSLRKTLARTGKNLAKELLFRR